MLKPVLKLLKKQTLRKVPEVTIFFWIIKLLSTALGESTSDYLVFHINPYIAVAFGAVGLIISLILQLSVDKYIAWIYWLAVVMVAVFGTMAADVLHVVLGIPYFITTVFFSISLAVVFNLWYRVEKTLSIHTINNLGRELFYWAAVISAFALGTAAGDLTAATLGLGYFLSGVLFTVIFVLPGIGRWKFNWNEVFSFWFAYVLTRPLGASFADYFGKPILDGLGLGDQKVSLVLAALTFIFVVYLSITRVDIKK
ncbi:hypothetical protein M1615_04485 [Patescibacteria group bacterium]|nr:hypothetical protein [Patescibacteria group bacterium]